MMGGRHMATQHAPVRRRPGVRRAAGALLVAVAALALAGCAGEASASAPSDGPVATTRVDLPRSYLFQPAAIVVTVGATVTWTNSDNFTHSVQFEGDAAPGAVLKPGASASRTFDAAGTYAYLCAFHPQNMRGTVEVTAASGTETP